VLSDSSTAAVMALHPGAPSEGSRAEREAPELEVLTREALDGNREAWSALIALHGRRVELSLVAQAVPPAQAREFAHDAWLRLMQQAAQGRLTYLQLPGLAIRQALFLARAARRRRDAAVTEVTDEAATEEAAAGGLAEEDVESPEVQFLARERLMRARARVDSLAPSARTVFLLLYAEPQLSHAELAARVGLSVQRVRQIICEVRKELRADLEESDARPRHP